jgi:D-amino-acid dehydrogenase
MRVAVIGAGIVGVTTAYELAVDGHEVAVLESGPTVAGGTSFANAGLLSPGTVAPWAAPDVPGRLLSQLLSRHAAMYMGWKLPWTRPRWLWRGWRACRPDVHEAHRRQMYALARFSLERVEQLTDGLRLDYERATGVTLLLRTDRELARARRGMKLLADLGVPFELVDAARARQIEPGLDNGTPLRGAIHLPRDGVGNCRQFAHLLKARAEQLGASFRFGQRVQAIRPGPPLSVHVAGQDMPFDAVVVCAGADAAPLLAPLGVKLPLLTAWSHSLTAPLRRLDGDAELGPRGALIDQTYQVTLARLGQRIRVSGGLELGGQAQRFHAGAVGTLYKALHDWFPGATQLAQAQRWKGAQAMLPDGPPVLGASGRPGVWLNLGHGSTGWAMAAGSARVIADLLGQRSPSVDVQGMGAGRWA